VASYEPDTRLIQWCVDALEAAVPEAPTETTADTFAPVRARLRLVGTRSAKFAYLDPDRPDSVTLRLYVGDTLRQARAFYGDADAVEGLFALSERGWQLAPSFHWGFMPRGLAWTASLRDARSYADYWSKRIGETRVVERDEWDGMLMRLIRDRIIGEGDIAAFDAHFSDTERQSATPRPALCAARDWPFTRLVEGDFPRELRSALREALLALREPLTTFGETAGQRR
jgi:hypothetical protein